LPDLTFPQNANASADAKDFIERLLEKDPEKRMSIEEALKHSFILSSGSEL
jgi:serine/threonine protein kinase